MEQMPKDPQQSGPRHTRALAFVETVVRSLQVMSAYARGVDRVTEAACIAERLRAFADVLVSRYPNEPVAHLALAAAYEQAAKNAWKPYDHDAIAQLGARDQRNGCGSVAGTRPSRGAASSG